MRPGLKTFPHGLEVSRPSGQAPARVSRHGEGMTKPAVTSIHVRVQAALLVLFLHAGAAAADTVTLVTPMVYGTHLPGLGAPARQLAKALEEGSKGTLKLDLKEPGDGTVPHEILDKVSDGKVDAGFATAGFWAAKVPAASLFGGYPFGPGRQGLPRLVQSGQRPGALSGDVRPGEGEGACHSLRLWRRRGGRLVRQGDHRQEGPRGLAHAHLRAGGARDVAARRRAGARAGKRPDRSLRRRQDRRRRNLYARGRPHARACKTWSSICTCPVGTSPPPCSSFSSTRNAGRSSGPSARR